MKKNLLLNPQKMQQIMADQKTQELLNLTVEFFEHKGNYSMRIDSKQKRLPTDWYQFIKESGLFKTLLTPAGYGDEDSRWDFYRISSASELMGFYGMYQYNFQVSVLGTSPIWSGKNEYQKQDLTRLLQEGHVFAFGLSEKLHGADIYTTDTTLQPIGDGKYIANGQKYYIGNASRAPKIYVYGKNTETGEYVSWVVDCRDRHCKYCGDIEIVGMFTGQLGYFDMIEYPVEEKDILAVGDDSFAMGLSSINIGKTQTAMKNVGMATHMLYEMVNHTHNRWLYGKRVSDMPHIKRMMLEAWSRILMSRLYNYRAVDYFRQANPADRRYLLFHPLQKARSAGECDRAVTLMHNVMAAKAYETDTFAETAVRQIGNSVRLEGTAHVNMSQAVKFARSYFFDNEDLPVVPEGKMIKDDSLAAFNQVFGKVRDIKFADYRRAFAGCELPNVTIFLEQAEAFKSFYAKTPLTREQTGNADFLLNVAEIFGAIVYGQLVFEKANLEGVEDMVIDQLFSYLVRDIDNYVTRQLCEYAGHFEDGQRDGLAAIVRDPYIDLTQEQTIIDEYVLALDNAYNGTTGVVIFE